MKQTKLVEQWLKELPESIRPKSYQVFKKDKMECLSEAILILNWGDDYFFYASLYESLKWAEEG